MWGLAFLRLENDGYAFFRPGFLPVFSIPGGDSSNFGWSGSSFAGPANVRLEPLAAATTQPSKGQDFERILQQEPFWDVMKSRYAQGRDHAAIELVCESMTVAADALANRSALRPS